MSEELRECPFCQSRAEHYSFTWRKHTVRCRYCLADCGEHETPERAAFVWNTRPAEDALKVEVGRLKNELGIQKNLTRQACFEANRAYDEGEKWKKMFYDLCDKQAKVSTDPKIIVINTDTGKEGVDE